MAEKELVAAAIEARKHAYAKYSDFPVGAALLCKDGRTFTGCNVENAVYPVGICAERTAVFKAVSEGHTEFKAIAVVTNSSTCVAPCGSCRQVLSEFSRDGSLKVIMASNDGHKQEVKTIGDLLPLAFSDSQLEDGKT